MRAEAVLCLQAVAQARMNTFVGLEYSRYVDSRMASFQWPSASLLSRENSRRNGARLQRKSLARESVRDFHVCTGAVIFPELTRCRLAAPGNSPPCGHYSARASGSAR